MFSAAPVGLLAMALAFEAPMARFVDLFRNHGEAVFPARHLPVGTVTRLPVRWAG